MYTKQQSLLANRVILMVHCRQHVLDPNRSNNPERRKTYMSDNIYIYTNICTCSWATRVMVSISNN